MHDFDLRDFFPYRVRVFAAAVSAAVTRVYTERHGLAVSEWRTMAILGSNRALSATEIVEKSSMDKVNVSRAVQSLRKKGLLKRDIDGDDRRRSVLRLTEEGNRIFQDLVPLVREVEQELIADLTEEELTLLEGLMDRVRKRADATMALTEPSV
ncbi:MULTISPECIES: MarR family winged helix-turn-helix transcriptional regulator [Pseudovibrio]|uniref:MarR family winged helix-turn-helix transcriptional regulator n=1 Tax=Stappiaceae TaxID=2821832 RepID=UPI002366BF39|nr:MULTISPECIES: MarR family transcriptional regulator [Pseudovibrio]MDD7909864.1 MarR family transcriptional regulator [Pseudovibrio exalbescens]MDX5592202.1 MarR family transcriptional regulator [Pseudovibrio sp. SPO723]